MTHFIRNGNEFQVAAQSAIDMYDKLPPGTYTVKFNPVHNVYWLEGIENLSVSGKIYGDTERTALKILATFEDRPNSTGVMLSGEKGSGKTLLARLLSVLARKEGIPTIVINQPWCGDTFNMFMQMIEQPVIVIFDEFEKVYDREQQEKMLTLLDGVYASKKLFVITCNDNYRIDAQLKNRPGRIYYHINYKGLEKDFIEEYCGDNLKDKKQIDSILKVSVLFNDNFNFDMLKAMVEEMNRYGESAQEVMRLLNTKPESNGIVRYNLTLEIDGRVVPKEELDDGDVWAGNPLVNEVCLFYKDHKQIKNPNAPKKKNSGDFFSADDDDDYTSTVFTPNDLKRIDPQTGKFHFVNAEGAKLSLVRVQAATYNYHAF